MGDDICEVIQQSLCFLALGVVRSGIQGAFGVLDEGHEFHRRVDGISDFFRALLSQLDEETPSNLCELLLVRGVRGPLVLGNEVLDGFGDGLESFGRDVPSLVDEALLAVGGVMIVLMAVLALLLFYHGTL